MPVSSFKGDFCNIDSFEPSAQTLDGIKEMNRIIDTANVLEAVLSGIPLFQLFASRSANGSVIIEGSASVVSTGINISIYDWKGFADAFKSVGIIRRRRLQDHADMTALNATGKDYEFWRCVSNAL
ncbi:hypothetical protein BZG05_12355 [Salinivibrio kushneri]|uniref:hypothetical protein n=1 Tax=Salinivibrio kushneri TaxID=1908198 RepID=UPI00098951B5|nr:hypothetical protein [Salinivibrio kushneri]OOE32921.1 hypothetical protein BZG05_12355 [Salinivibrio kushneri]